MIIIFKKVCKKSVFEINKGNVEKLSLYNDNITDQETANKINHHNEYINNVLNKPESVLLSNCNFHQCVHKRSPSYYEDLILFGGTGLDLMIITMQTIAMIFVLWATVLLFKHLGQITTSDTVYLIFLIIPLLIVYIVGMIVLLGICMKLYTIMASVSYIIFYSFRLK
jgi:hypothetical protein